MSWVPASNPPWKARNPNGDRSSVSSVTRGCESRSANVSTASMFLTLPEGMALGHLDHGDLHPVGIGDPHLPQPPRLGERRAQDLDRGGGQLLMGGVDVA